MNVSEHDEIRSLLGVYALDAVDNLERERVEDHLTTCLACSAEVADHREAAASLAFAGGDAPAGLWDRIAAELHLDDTSSAPSELAALSREPAAPSSPPPAPVLSVPVPDETELEGPAPRRRTSGDRTVGGSTDRPLTPGDPTIISLDSRRRRPRWFAPALAAAAVVAAVAIGIAVGRSGVDQTQTASTELLAEQAISANGSRVAALDGDGPSIRAVVEPSGTGYVFADSLPALPADQTYQLWGVRGDTVVSLGVFGPNPGVVAFTAAPDTEALAITAEVAGGVVSSAQKPVAVGPLA